MDGVSYSQPAARTAHRLGAVLLLAAAGCSGGDNGTMSSGQPMAPTGTSAAGIGTNAAGTSPSDTSATQAAMSPSVTMPVGGAGVAGAGGGTSDTSPIAAPPGSSAGTPGAQPATDDPTDPATQAPAAAGTAPADPANPLMPPGATPAGSGNQPAMNPPPANSGPIEPHPVPDGDPNGSGGVVSIPDAPCGPAAGLDAFVAGTGIPGPGTPNVQIGGRDVVLSYPCTKRQGAHVTFILNLHGTMPDDSLKLYQHGYFSIHKLVDSHSLIVATPKSVVSQWGNMDDGADVPHLYEVVDWVYSKFSDFKITGMWVAGHSWGSMFAKNFVCDEMFRDKAWGVIGQSGGATGVGTGGFGGTAGSGSSDCAARLSQIHTVGDAEGGESGVPDQTAAATAHGCGARLAPRDIGGGQMLYEWPDCDPGWVHFNFVMGGHEHITAIDDPVVKYIADAIKSTEKR